MLERLKYWLFRKGKDCKHCCLRCEYYAICRWDIDNKAELAAGGCTKLARGNGKYELRTKMCQYIIFKQKERQKNEKL